MYRVTLAVAAVLAMAAAVGASLNPSEAARLQAAARVAREISKDIPPEYWERARCVAVIPEVKKAAFIIGGEYGKGVMSCRAGDGWSAPLFVQLAKGSWGFQAGAQQVDLVLLVMNESGVQKLLRNKVTLGADASVAAGPIGRQGAVATDAALSAEILSYSRAQGLFAGIDLSGGVLRPDEDANRAAYGSGAAPRTILASRQISAPTEASAFLAALSATTSRPTTATTTEDRAPRSTEAEPRATTRSTTDDDLRARAIDMQQTLDRLLGETTPPSVGASGTMVPGTSATTGATPTSTTTTTRSDDMVVVSRARLLQLRQQLDALIAALNRR